MEVQQYNTLLFFAKIMSRLSLTNVENQEDLNLVSLVCYHQPGDHAGGMMERGYKPSPAELPTVHIE